MGRCGPAAALLAVTQYDDLFLRRSTVTSNYNNQLD
jgi:hypothetical protein